MKRIIGADYPLVRQTLNTCGLASLSMILFHHSPSIKPFLVDLFDKRELHGQAIPSKDRVPDDTKCISSLGYLLLRAKNSRKFGNIISIFSNGFEYEDFKLEVDLLVDSAMNSRHVMARIPNFKTLANCYRGGVVRKRFLAFYLDQYKTQIELKVLALLFGFQYVPYPGDVLGNLYFVERDADATKKFEFMKGIMGKTDNATLLGHGQSHWMVPHSILADGNGADNTYFLGINDPLGSSTRVPFSTLNASYIFYFFKHHKDASDRSVEKLKNWFNL
nr:hypothetical protein [Candidatus Sigynarchaeota archaeon]